MKKILILAGIGLVLWYFLFRSSKNDVGILIDTTAGQGRGSGPTEPDNLEYQLKKYIELLPKHTSGLPIIEKIAARKIWMLIREYEQNSSEARQFQYFNDLKSNNNSLWVLVALPPMPPTLFKDYNLFKYHITK